MAIIGTEKETNKINKLVHDRNWHPRGGGTWIIFGWVCVARDSKLAPRSKKNFP